MRRIVPFSLLVLSALVFLVSFVLLLNVTAPNPTYRRYSSEPAKSDSSSSSSHEIGEDGERILAKDLGVRNNNDSSGGLCFCNTDEPGGRNCKHCLLTIESLEGNLVPDFVTDSYIADSKNIERISGHDIKQIEGFVLGAEQLGVPLWIYVRKDEVYSERIDEIVESTGGDVVYYFTYPGYVDPVDRWAWRGIAVAVCTSVLVVIWFRVDTWRTQRPKRPQRPGPKTPATRANRSVDTLETFTTRREESARRTIDVGSACAGCPVVGSSAQAPSKPPTTSSRASHADHLHHKTRPNDM